MSNEQEKREELKKEMTKEINDIDKVEETEQMIKDNKIVFEVDDKKYRVRKATYDESRDIEKFRKRTKLAYMDDETMLFRSQWIEKYKKNGIDIEAKEQHLRNLQDEIEKLMLRLAKTTSESAVEKLKAEQTKMRNEQIELSIEITDLMADSIEDQLALEVNSYYTFMVLEEQKGDKWVKVYKDFTVFMESSNLKLIKTAFYYIQFIIYNSLT